MVNLIRNPSPQRHGRRIESGMTSEVLRAQMQMQMQMQFWRPTHHVQSDRLRASGGFFEK